VHLPEFACNLSIPNRIEEIAENSVCVRVYVGAFAALLERLKFVNRVLFSHNVFDLKFKPPVQSAFFAI